MFGLYSGVTYKPITSKHYVLIFKIETLEFINKLANDVSAFKHFHDMGLQKLRFHQHIEKEINKKWRQIDQFGTT
jgi:hypothetical protein